MLNLGILVTINQIFTINVSPSIPKGLYIRQFGQPVQQGTIVRIDGYPYGRRLDMLKYVAALPGQSVQVSHNLYITDGRTWNFPTKGTLQVKAFDGPVPVGHIFVAGSHPHSYDSRYFGAVPISMIKAQYRHLWVWGD